MKVFKKIISVILAIIMVVGVFAILPNGTFAPFVKAFAETADTIEYADSALTSEENIPQVKSSDSAPASRIVIETPASSFKYTTSNMEVTITGYIGSSTEVVIPSKIDGYPVTSIGMCAFGNCTSLTSITIPSSVTSIGVDAFYNCASLISITIPNSVTSMDFGVFSGCTSITSITIPSSVTSMGNGTFSYCTSLTSITIPNSVTSIGDGAFSGCTSLTSITIPNSITSVGSYAFENCTSLTSLTIPSSVTSIGAWAFKNCTSLTSITIPSSVTNIGDYVFYSCTSLTSTTIPSSVTSIGAWAFKNCTSLTSITIPDSVTSIGDDAFSGCTSLTSITIPSSVTGIGSYTFKECDSLKNVYFNNPDMEIGSAAFENCDNTVIIHCREGGNVENYVNATTGLVFKGKVSIDYNANGGAGASSSVISDYGDTIILSTTIPTKANYTFKDWNTEADGSGESYEAGVNFVAIDDITFYAQWTVAKYTVTFDANGGTGAPEQQTKNREEDMTISAVMPIRTGYVFMGWADKQDAVKAIYIPNGKYDVNGEATLYAVWMKNEDLWASIIRNDKAEITWFMGDKVDRVLEEVTLPNTLDGKEVVSISDNGLQSMYATKYTVNADNKYFSCALGCLFSKELTKFIRYPINQKAETFVFSNDMPITELGNYAFYKAENIKMIQLSEKMSKIGEGAFEECTNLVDLIINNPYAELNEAMFSGCKQTITIHAHTGSKAETFVNAINDEKRFKFESIREMAKTAVYGDLDGDSKVSMQDVVELQKAIAGLLALADTQKKSADVDGDGKTSMQDVVTIQRFIAQLITEFPVQSVA